MLKKLIGNKVAGAVLDKKFVILGVVLAIGSVGLLMGAFTYGVAVLLMTRFGFEMVAAMAISFFGVGISF